MAEFSVEAFEQSGRENGSRFWFAHEFMASLGYDSWSAFQSVITKAMGSCTKLDLDPTEAFIPDTHLVDGRPQKTYRLTRFACLLVSMHADARKPEVAKAKAVLAAIADHLIGEKIKEQDLGRIETRDDLKLAEKVLGGVAKAAGLENQQFAIFKDAGFRGMYNMSLQQLKQVKGVPADGAVLYDFMGLEELAGNLFRVTQTAARVKSQGLSGLAPLQQTATEVGREVRGIMVKNSGIAPEKLPIDQDITKVRRKLKATGKQMNKLDTLKRIAKA